MTDEAELILPNYRQAASHRVRRRIYVAMIVAAAIFLAGLLYWPLQARTFRTTAEITVQLPSRSVVGAALQSASDRDLRLRQVIGQALSDQALAATIRRASLPASAGVAQLKIPQVRQGLQIEISTGRGEYADRRRVEIAWIGSGSDLDRRLVDALAEEIAANLARETGLESLRRKLSERFDQIAQDQRRSGELLLGLIDQNRSELQRHSSRLTQLRRQLAGLSMADPGQANVIQQEAEEMRHQVLSSDAHLLQLLRQQIMSHFEVDETDGLVQHLERLIEDRRMVMAEFDRQSQVNQLPESAGRVPVREAGFQRSTADQRVQENPYFTAAVDADDRQQQAAEWAAFRQTIGQIRADHLEERLNQLQAALEQTATQTLPVLDVVHYVKRDEPWFRVTQLQAAVTSPPLDAVPRQRWLMGLSLLAVALGSAFALGQSPESLSRSIFRPRQLADYLGIDHLGTIHTQRQQPTWLDNWVKLMGRRVFQAAEALLLVMLCGLIVAATWEPTIAANLLSNPLEAYCQAAWLLLGR